MELIQKHSAIAAILAVTMLTFALMNSSNEPMPSSSASGSCHHIWYYDLNTRELFRAPYDSGNPCDAPSGPRADGTPAGVFATVYACGDCDDLAARQIVLSKPEWSDGRCWTLSRLDDEDNWAYDRRKTVHEYLKIMQSRCPAGTALRHCKP